MPCDPGEPCGRPVYARGWCTRHYLRWWRNGDPLRKLRRGRGRKPAGDSPTDLAEVRGITVQRAYQLLHPELLLAYQRAYRKAHPEKGRAASRAYRARLKNKTQKEGETK